MEGETILFAFRQVLEEVLKFLMLMYSSYTFWSSSRSGSQQEASWEHILFIDNNIGLTYELKQLNE